MKIPAINVPKPKSEPAERELTQLVTTVGGVLPAQPGLSAAENAERLNKQIEAYARTNVGATGADGWRGIQLSPTAPDKPARMLWGLGDTFVGGVTPEGKRETPWGRPDQFVRGTMLLQEGQKFATIAASDKERFAGRGGFVEPAATETVGYPQMPMPSRWFWPGAMANNGSGVDMVLNDWGLGPQNNPYNWDWQLHGTDVVHFEPDKPAVTKVTHVSTDDNIIWGAAITNDAKYTYIYGASHVLNEPSSLAVARVPKGDLSAPWEFRSTKGWTLDVDKAVRTLDTLPNQFSVMQSKDGYVLLAQPGYENRLDVYRSKNPEGPFIKEKSMPLDNPGVPGRIGYQAVVNEALSDSNNLLVAVNQSNINPDDKTGLFSDFRNYLPHFQAVPRP